MVSSAKNYTQEKGMHQARATSHCATEPVELSTAGRVSSWKHQPTLPILSAWHHTRCSLQMCPHSCTFSQEVTSWHILSFLSTWWSPADLPYLSSYITSSLKPSVTP
jgi:hypothetical protein